MPRKHSASKQYRFAEKCLKKLEGHEKYEEMKERVWHYNKAGVWFPIEVATSIMRWLPRTL